MTPAEREALPPLDFNDDEIDLSLKTAAYFNNQLVANLACRERQLLAKMSLISSLELTLSNSTNLNVMQMSRIDALEASGKWIPVNQELPPQDGSCFMVCIGNHPNIRYAPTTCFWGTYHPNAKGKAQYRDSSGVKINFTHWQPLPETPTEPTPEESK